MAKRALITGCAGQDGSYLAEFLLGKDYEVFGTTRVSINPNTRNLAAIINHPHFHLLQADMSDAESLARAVRRSEPDEVYNLAAVSFAPASWDCPAHVMDVNAAGTIRLLEAVRNIQPSARFYQASTSEMFGAVTSSPQDEHTLFRPVQPYGAAKLAAHWSAVSFREQYGMFVCCGILFNHESPRRGPQFVTSKIIQAAVEISKGKREKLTLWSLAPVRDWGFAGDYVRAMWQMLQMPMADDYVVGTGVGHTVGDVVERAFGKLNLDWKKYVEIAPPHGWSVDPRANYVADARRAHFILNWHPTVRFLHLIDMMVDAALKL